MKFAPVCESEERWAGVVSLNKTAGWLTDCCMDRQLGRGKRRPAGSSDGNLAYRIQLIASEGALEMAFT
eukprot:scaffold323089_cov37-Tisochrysis_lutea.AAC.2